MGLIKAATGAIGSTLSDQWKEVIRCEDMGNDILMMKKTTKNGVISKGSTIIVAPDQCAVIYDNGKIIDATAEEGMYTFDESTSPSFFAGQFGAVFKEMWQRFTYNGGTAKQQAVFFFNLKEIIKNPFGTPQPVLYQDWSHPIANPRTGEFLPLKVKVKCFGTYTFKIVDPSTFMQEVAGTVDVYRKTNLIEQMRSEVIATFSNVLNELGNSKNKIAALELPSQTDEIKQMMDEKIFDEPIRRRGLSIVVFAVESVSLDEESEAKIDEYEATADLSNSYIQQGKLVDAYANAIQNAASNESGTINGFMGIGMMNMATNGMMGAAAQSPWQNNQNTNPNIPQPNTVINTVVPDTKTEENTWECPNCKKQVSGKFCSECGTKKSEEKKCTNCGKVVEPNAKFCPECGKQL